MKTRKKDDWLWAVWIRNSDLQYWIIANKSIDSAMKKAERFFAKLAAKNGQKPYQIKKIESRGTIDVF
jgi:hypothetical protein